ncbi:MAG: DUF3784 domain-containing protein [Oscillospiraceae bacterium]|nr:DUF3784 domain-containing protein [Oscillospiraceae bacterium]
MVICYMAAAMLLVVGVAFLTGKAPVFIKAYRLMPEEEKEKINIKPLCRNLSAAFLIAAAIFGAAGYSEVFRLIYFKWAVVGWLALCCADIAYIGKSKRYIK